MEEVLATRAGALGHFGDARRAAMGSALVGRVVETGSLVIRKLGGTRAREIAIHRFLSAPSDTCAEMVETLADGKAAACRVRRIVAANLPRRRLLPHNFAFHQGQNVAIPFLIGGG